MDPLAELEAVVASIPSAVVAFSGGVDSSVVAAAAARVLGERAVAVTAVSPALATGELDGARAVSRAIGIEHEIVTTDELAREGYRRNDRDRCYHCKVELYEVLAAVAERRGFFVLLSGANADDLGDWRPGLRAAAERGVRHPLVEAGLGKAAVRAIAHALGLPNAQKPASPCLASRLPYGTAVEVDVLAQVDRAEAALKHLGFRELRVRHFGPLARVELGAEDLGRVRADGDRDRVAAAVRAAGYADVEIDAFSSGSLNRILRPLPIVQR
jgi:pyridinium-3,5-biscarboxylic acid mononucleotide sulfurtransferase